MLIDIGTICAGSSPAAHTSGRYKSATPSVCMVLHAIPCTSAGSKRTNASFLYQAQQVHISLVTMQCFCECSIICARGWGRRVLSAAQQHQATKVWSEHNLPHFNDRVQVSPICLACLQHQHVRHMSVRCVISYARTHLGNRRAPSCGCVGAAATPMSSRQCIQH